MKTLVAFYSRTGNTKKVALLKTRSLEEAEEILKNCKNYDEASTSTIV